MNVFLICSARPAQIGRLVESLRFTHAHLAVTFYVKEKKEKQYRHLLAHEDQMLTYNTEKIKPTRTIIRHINSGPYDRVLVVYGNETGAGYSRINRMLLLIRKPCFLVSPEGNKVEFRCKSLFYIHGQKHIKTFVFLVCILCLPLYPLLLLLLLVLRFIHTKTAIMYVLDTSIDHPLSRSQAVPLMARIPGHWRKFIVSYREPTIFNRQEIHRQKKRLANEGIQLITLTQRQPLEKMLTDLFILPFLACSRRISHYHSRTYHPALVGVILKKIAGIFFIFDPRGIYPEESVYLEKFKAKSFTYKLFKKIEKISLAAANVNIVVSDNFLRHLAAVSPRTRQESFFLMPTFLSDELYDKYKDSPQAKTEFKKNLGFSPADYVFVYSGSLARWQMPEIVLQSFKTINTHCRNREMKLLLLTNEKHHEAIKRKIQQHRLPGVSIRSCHTLESTIEHLLAGDCAFLLREDILINHVSCPTKFAEYLLAGLPIIATPGIGDISGIIKKYQLGTLIRLNDTENLAPAVKIIEHMNYQAFLQRRNHVLENHFLAGAYILAYISRLASKTGAREVVLPRSRKK